MRSTVQLDIQTPHLAFWLKRDVTLLLSEAIFGMIVFSIRIICFVFCFGGWDACLEAAPAELIRSGVEIATAKCLFENSSVYECTSTLA